MRPELPTLIAFSFLAAAPAAQNIIPTTMDGIEGGGGTNIPFGGSQACRYQVVYDAEELPWTGPLVINGIRIRPDFNNGAASPAKGFLDISVLVSTTHRDSATSSSDFDDNYGTDAQWVIENSLVQLPAQPPISTGSGPRPANIDLPFTTPWIYGLTPATQSLPAPDNLLVEIHIHSQPSGSYRVDNLSSCTAPTAEFGNVGPACSFTGNGPVLLTGDVSMLAGANYTWRVDDAPPLAPFLVAINLTDQGNVFNIPGFALPYPLFDPANPSQPSALLQAAGLPWSAPDCWFNVDPAASYGGATDANGSGLVTAALPAGREFVGTTFYAQAIVYAQTVNPLQFVTSKGRETTVCGPLGVARIFKFYNPTAVPAQPVPTAGSKSLGVGFVIEVY
ncbi:MAG: hypothetical protein ACE37K_18290 [Planctomycetota bacterium]